MSKSKQIKAIRGMNDILPCDSALWLKVEAICANRLAQYGFQQIRTPIIEKTTLFSRSIGDDTDVVAKEMYTFDDRNGDSLSLRPEGTASCVRAGIENGLFYNQLQRLWYIGPMFRHERPQKGRYRQFNQIGAECYGWSDPDIEAEMLSLLAQIFSDLGLQNTELQINSLGDKDSRRRYREALVAYLNQHRDDLDEDSLLRLQRNPLRILDSKNPQVQTVLENAPSILDFLSVDSHASFAQLQRYLAELGIVYTVNPRLVRGLDYYNDTVFEWINPQYGAQAAICGGGRYDGMVEQLGGKATAGFGFAMGLERLIQILQEQQAPIISEIANDQQADVYIISVGDHARQQALHLQQSLIGGGLQALLHCGAASMKNQFKHAHKSGAKIALVIGDDEAKDQTVSIKPLLGVEHSQVQQIIVQNDALNTVTNLLKSL